MLSLTQMINLTPLSFFFTPLVQAAGEEMDYGQLDRLDETKKDVIICFIPVFLPKQRQSPLVLVLFQTAKTLHIYVPGQIHTPLVDAFIHLFLHLYLPARMNV